MRHVAGVAAAGVAGDAGVAVVAGVAAVVAAAVVAVRMPQQQLLARPQHSTAMTNLALMTSHQPPPPPLPCLFYSSLSLLSLLL